MKLTVQSIKLAVQNSKIEYDRQLRKLSTSSLTALIISFGQIGEFMNFAELGNEGERPQILFYELVDWS